MGLIGYARVSATEDKQVLDRQLDALAEVKCERVFEDRASGAKADRPGLDALPLPPRRRRPEKAGPKAARQLTAAAFATRSRPAYSEATFLQ